MTKAKETLMSETNPIPILCELPIEAQSKRAAELRHGLFSGCHEVEELPDGYALRFDWGAERLRALGAFLATESDCCPFLRYELVVHSGRTQISLALTGSNEAKHAITSDLFSLVPDTARRARASKGPWRRGRLAGSAAVSTIGTIAVLCCAAPAIGATLGLGAVSAYTAELDAVGAATVVLGTVMTAIAVARWQKKALSSPSCGC